MSDPLVFGGRAAYAADVLALGRATLEAMERALRNAPEVRAHRLLARWSLDQEALLFELAPTVEETSLQDLAHRMGSSPPQVRATAVRLQRLGLVAVSEETVRLTGPGRQKLGRLEAARAAVLRRIAGGIEASVSEGEAEQILGLLQQILDQTEAMADAQHAPSKASPGPGAGTQT